MHVNVVVAARRADDGCGRRRYGHHRLLLLLLLLRWRWRRLLDCGCPCSASSATYTNICRRICRICLLLLLLNY